jgi:hypothetical protein
MDKLIRWALLDEVAGEDPSPQVWQNIQARVMLHSQGLPSQPEGEHPWRDFASSLRAWALGITAPLNMKWDSRLTPRERAYLIWRENLLLSILSTTTVTIY